MKKNTYQNENGDYIGNTPLDAYNFYKKNELGVQNMLSSLNPISNTNQNTVLGMKPSLLKGILLGAGVALVATNPKIQKAVVGATVKAWAGLQANIEEMKEQVNDAKAEMAQENE